MNKIIKTLVDFDIRFSKFQQSMHFINYELIEGDIFEFGIYTGRSLLLLQHAYDEECKSIHKINFDREFIGFDSFNGLKESSHPRWGNDDFSVNHSFNPVMKVGEKVTKKCVYKLFNEAKLKHPKIIEGDFEQSLPEFLKHYTKKISLIHIDCDLYKSAKVVLNMLENHMQEGTILLFDDWFHYRGGKNKGEQKAFYEFKEKSQWDCLHYGYYATFANSFIIIKK